MPASRRYPKVEAPGLFTAEQTAVKLDVSIATLWRWVRAGRIDSTRLWNRRLFTEEQIEAARRKAQ